jgi:hypothetical protein
MLSLSSRIIGLLMVAASWPAHADVEPLTPEQMTEATFLETISIPSPGEFFVAFDKLCQPNWSKVLRSSISSAASEREHIALQLGMVLADGFAAIEAQDGQGVKNTARDVLVLAKKLNVSHHIVARSQSISDFAQASDWRRLREEFDAMQNDIRLSLLEQKDSSLVVLMMAGSWVRQMDIATNIFLKLEEGPASMALLRQSELASRILRRMEHLPEASKKSDLVRRVIEVLQIVSSSMSDGVSSIPPEFLANMASSLSAITSAAADADSKK